VNVLADVLFVAGIALGVWAVSTLAGIGWAALTLGFLLIAGGLALARRHDHPPKRS
jgi:hypothetical protein